MRMGGAVVTQGGVDEHGADGGAADVRVIRAGGAFEEDGRNDEAGGHTGGIVHRSRGSVNRLAAMRLAIVDQVGGTGGIARFMHSLAWGLLRLPELEGARFDVVLHGPISGTTYAWPQELRDPRLTVHTMPGMEPSRHPLARVRRRTRRLLNPASPLELAARRLAWVESFVERAQPDAALFTSPYGMPLPRWPGVKVVTVHDCNHRRFETWPPQWRDQIDRDLPGWLTGARVVVPSGFSASELERFYGADRAHLTVIPYGIHPAAEPRRPEPGPPARFLLSLAAVAPHKDLGTAVAALARLRATRPDLGDLALVVAGGQSDLAHPAPHSHAEAIARRVRELDLRIGTDVVGMGSVSDSEIEWLLQHAVGLVAPTLYEGGSLPVLEALRSGCRVACSRIPTFLEQLPPLAALGAGVHWFDPGDADGCAAAIEAMLEAPPPAGEAVLRTFDREQAARAYFELVRDALGGGARIVAP